MKGRAEKAKRKRKEERKKGLAAEAACYPKAGQSWTEIRIMS